MAATRIVYAIHDLYAVDRSWLAGDTFMWRYMLPMSGTVLLIDIFQCTGDQHRSHLQLHADIQTVSKTLGIGILLQEPFFWLSE